MSPCLGLGQNNIKNNIEINLFPNPVTNVLNVKISNSDKAEITLYDYTSRKLIQEIFRNFTTLNLEQLAKGIYFYEIHTKNGVTKKGKVIK